MSLFLFLEDEKSYKVVEVGTSCKNNGCTANYTGLQSNEEECLYHEGAPIFHEGLKFWSCCKRKTTDFEMFLSQTGCASGRHVWFKAKTCDTQIEKSKTCRYDWHQTASNIVVTIYSKLPLPDQCLIKANPVRLEIFIIFGFEERKEFVVTLDLFGVIDVGSSTVEYTPSKVEIVLKKTSSNKWDKLVC